MSSNVLRSLYVLVLAFFGLCFYVLMLTLLVFAVVFGFSRIAHAAGTGTTAAASANIDAGFTGSWYDPAESGQGLMIEVLSDKELLAFWFAFSPTGEQAWFGGVGSYSGNTATVNAYLPTGGRWLTNFDSSSIVPNAWGTLKFTFSDHDHGRVDFNSDLGYGLGGMNLTRLTNVATQPASAIAIGTPTAIAVDAAGNAYFSSSPNRIFRLDTGGAVTRVAGSGDAGYSGDGGPAIQAQLNFPLNYPERQKDPVNYSPLVGGLAVDATGTVFVADAYNNRIRAIEPNGIITTVAGDGTRANSGDGSPATQAQIYWPQGVALDGAGNLYASSAYGPLRKVGSGHAIATVAVSNCGTGFLGPGLCAPVGIAADPIGNVFVADGYCRVRMVTPVGDVVTVAGDDRRPDSTYGTAFTCGYSGDGGPALDAALNNPFGVAADAQGNLFIADTGNSCVRRVDHASGIITTVAGICTKPGYSGDGGAAKHAQLATPYGVAVAADGTLYIADTGNGRVRRVAPDGTIATVAGNGAAVDESAQAAIGPGYSGNWFNPQQSGHGLIVEVLPQNRLLALWFAFTPDGSAQSWFGGLGTYSGNTATITGVALPSGGYWLPDFDPGAVVTQDWGTLKFTFDNCNSGRVDFSSDLGYGSGELGLKRLTMPAGLSCP